MTEEIKITAIGIRFADNDFYNTFRSLFKGILNNLEFNPTKEQVVEIVNHSIYAFYLAFQNKWKYNSRLPEKYLSISKENVYFNEEVDKYVKDKDGWDNSEFYYCSIGGEFKNFHCI